MPRQLNRLTDARVRRETRPGRYADGNGLYLQVGKSGKSWLFRYMLNGKAREMDLGSVRLISLAVARRKAIDQQKLLLEALTQSKNDKLHAHKRHPYPSKRLQAPTSSPTKQAGRTLNTSSSGNRRSRRMRIPCSATFRLTARPQACERHPNISRKWDSSQPDRQRCCSDAVVSHRSRGRKAPQGR